MKSAFESQDTPVQILRITAPFSCNQTVTGSWNLLPKEHPSHLSVLFLKLCRWLF